MDPHERAMLTVAVGDESFVCAKRAGCGAASSLGAPSKQCWAMLCICSTLVASACGSAEPPVRWARGSDGQDARWGHLEQTLTVAPPPVGTRLRWSEIHAAALYAVEQWGLTSQIRLVGGEHRSASEDGLNVLLVASHRDAQLAQLSRGVDAETKLYTRSTEEDHAEIVEADIIVPLASVDWASTERMQQLRALLVHELGHFVGLDHTCSRGISGPLGPAACSSNSKLQEQAMYPDALERRSNDGLRPSRVELAAIQERYGLD